MFVVLVYTCVCMHACMRVLVNVHVHIVPNYMFACVCLLYCLQQPLPVSLTSLCTYIISLKHCIIQSYMFLYTLLHLATLTTSST